MNFSECGQFFITSYCSEGCVNNRRTIWHKLEIGSRFQTINPGLEGVNAVLEVLHCFDHCNESGALRNSPIHKKMASNLKNAVRDRLGRIGLDEVDILSLGAEYSKQRDQEEYLFHL